MQKKDRYPPGVAKRFLRSFCPEILYEGIMGDLIEQFDNDVKIHGVRKAQLRFIWNVFRFFRPGIILRNRIKHTSSLYAHLRNDLKISYRSIVRQRFYSIVNIAGLTISMTTGLFMLIYVLDELSYDQHIEDADQIYRVTLTHESDQMFYSAWTPPPIGLAFQQEYPEIEMFTTFRKYWKGFSIQQENNQIPVHSVYLANESFLDFFSFELLSGDKNSALNSPDNILISARLALQLFEAEDVVGKSIRTTFGDKIITGVLMPDRRRSHIEYPDVVVSLIGFNNRFNVLENWSDDASYYNYIKLNDGTTFSEVEGKLNAAGRGYLERWMRGSQSGHGQYGVGSTSLNFQKLTDIHLHSRKEFEITPNGNALYVYLFSGVGALLLVIATINYINLAIARSSSRSKEIGIRKTLGSQKGQLIRQFMTESFLIILCAFTLSMILLILALPQFKIFIEKSFTISEVFSPGVIRLIVMVLVALTISGGFYPSLIMSSYKPVNALKGKAAPGDSIVLLRKGLVVVQFVSAMVLIACTFTVFIQLKFISRHDLGFEQEQVLAITIDAPEDREKIPVLKSGITADAAVESVGLTAQLPGGGNLKAEPFMLETMNGTFSERLVQYAFVDSSFAHTLKLRILHGRNFQEGKDTQGASVIVNEKLVKSMGWSEPLGKKVRLPIGQDAEVVGVIKDFHIQSLHDEIQPFFLIHLPEFSNILLVKFTAKNIPEFVSKIRAEYENVFKGGPMNFTFLDQQFARQYREDEKRGRLFAIFSGIAIVISCIGLFALMGLSISQRTKEIGIRRVMGATALSILNLLSKDFLKLITLAVLVGFPVAYFAIDSWLQTFSYRIDITWWIFVIPMMLTLLFAILAMSFQWNKAVNLNTIDSLRCE